MIQIENVETFGWEAAVRGMRNPMNSWDKSDSDWDWVEDKSPINPNDPGMCYVLGDNDLSLMQKLIASGSDHRKFMRMILVSCDLTAPLYWWKEYDTYKVGTVANSCSTMHKIHAKPFELDDFSHEHLDIRAIILLKNIISALNDYRLLYLNYNSDDFEIKGCPSEKDFWWQMIQLLPSSYNQRRTVLLNYEVLANIYRARKAHKLDEWRFFCQWIETLPYADLITGGVQDDAENRA